MPIVEVVVMSGEKVSLSLVEGGAGVGAGVGSGVLTCLCEDIWISSNAISPRKSSTVFVAMKAISVVAGGRTTLACSQSDASTDPKIVPSYHYKHSCLCFNRKYLAPSLNLTVHLTATKGMFPLLHLHHKNMHWV